MIEVDRDSERVLYFQENVTVAAPTLQAHPILLTQDRVHPTVVQNDPRMNPNVTAVFEPFGLADAPEPLPVSKESSMEEIQAWSVEAEAGYKGLFDALSANLPPLPAEVEQTTEVITGVDGNEINLYIHKPKVHAPCSSDAHRSLQCPRF
eukprot:SAG11_NODE_744_length_7406_cov_2.773231_6_plen_150_part_00